MMPIMRISSGGEVTVLFASLQDVWPEEPREELEIAMGSENTL